MKGEQTFTCGKITVKSLESFIRGMRGEREASGKEWRGERKGRK